jgi:hypothetical protein
MEIGEWDYRETTTMEKKKKMISEEWESTEEWKQN